MLLGALTRQMHTHGLLNPKPAKPFLGHSVEATASNVRSFISPKWGEAGSYDSYRDHECTLATFLDPCVSSVVDGIEGLELEEFQFSQVQPRAASRSSGGA